MPNYRIYYNRHKDYPFVWSIDEGSQDTEINLIDVILHKVNRVQTGGDITAPRHSETVPAVWFDVFNATLAVKDGVAHLFQDPNWRVPAIEKGKYNAESE